MILPFNVRFTLDPDTADEATGLVGTLSANYNPPLNKPLGNCSWSWSERVSAADVPALASKMCADFEAWKVRRLKEVAIEATLVEDLLPLCPCEVPEPETEPEPKGEGEGDEPKPEAEPKEQNPEA